MTSALNEKFEQLKRRHPNANVEDLIETSVMSLEGTLPTITEAQFEREKEQLAKLEKFMGVYETANFLFDTCGPDAIGTALRRIEEQERANPTIAWAMNNPQYYNQEEEDETDMDNQSLLDAIEETIENGSNEDLEELLEKLKSRRHKVRVGVNRTKVTDNRTDFNAPVRSFNALVNRNASQFNRLAQLHKEGEQLSDAEFDSLAENVLNEDDTDNLVNENASFRIRQIMVQKAAEKRYAEARKKAGVACENEDGPRRRPASTTPAQDTIKAHGTPSDDAVKAMLPHEPPAIRVPDISVAAALPDEFRPKIERSTDNSYVAQMKDGRMKNDGEAAKTIERPSKIDFKDQENSDQLPKYWAREKAVKTAADVPAASTYKTQPNQQGYTKMDQKTLIAILPPNVR